MRVIGSLALQTSDTQAPTVPQNLSATAINKTRVDLSWSASTDNVGVSGYQIFRDGSPLTTVDHPTTSHSDVTAAPSTAYTYAVSAYDAAGNSSAASGTAQATTPANAAPSWTAIPDQDLIIGDSFVLNLNSFCTDADLDTITYSIFSGTLPTGLSLSGSSISGTPTVAGQSLTVTVRASDSVTTADATIDFATFDADVTAPPVPTGLAATALSSSQISVSWNASTDAAGSANEYVSGTSLYNVYRDGAFRASTAATTYSDTGLSASTQYSYRVSAEDAEGNESAQATAVTATTSSAAAYVSPYSTMTQRYMSSTGAGSQNGLSAANAWPFSPAGWALFAASGPGVRLRLQPGTYQPFSSGWSASSDMNCDGTGMLRAQRYVITPEPGSAPLSVIFDLETGGSWFNRGVAYNIWDGEDSGFRIINGGAFSDFESTLVPGFWLFNFHDVTGTTDFGAGGANGAPFTFRSDTSGATPVASYFQRAENFKVTWNENVNGQNSACLFLWRSRDFVARNFELYGSGGNVWNDKHPTVPVSVNQSNIVIERGLISNSTGGGYQESSMRSRMKDMILGRWTISEGGGQGSNTSTRSHSNRWRRITTQGSLTAGKNGQSGSGPPGTGAPDQRIRESVINGTHERELQDFPDLDQIAYGNDLILWDTFDNPSIGYNGDDLSFTVVQSRSAPMSTNPNSVGASVSFVGSDRQDPLSWALASGSAGKAAGVTGRDWGAKVANVGLKTAAEIRPAVYNDWLSSTLNQWADQSWTDIGGIDIGTHPRHGLGCYRARWASGAAQTPTPNSGVCRHLFPATNDFTLYFTFWTSANFRGRAHLIHIKTTSNTAEAPGTGFTLYFEPRQPTDGIGHGNPGYFVADLRNLSGFQPEMRSDSASNLALDADIDVMDGDIHYIELYCRANTVGQSNGILEAYVDNVMTLGFNDVNFMTQGGQQFQQILIAPYLSSNEGLPTETIDLNMGDELRLFAKDW